MIHIARTAEEAVALRHSLEGSAYLAGGTEMMRLGSSLSGVREIIDVSSLPLSGISNAGGKVRIGALTTLQDVKESLLVPAFIREAASFCAIPTPLHPLIQFLDPSFCPQIQEYPYHAINH